MLGTWNSTAQPARRRHNTPRLAPEQAPFPLIDPDLRARLERYRDWPGMTEAVAQRMAAALDGLADLEDERAEAPHTPRLPRGLEELVATEGGRTVLDALACLHLQRQGRPFPLRALTDYGVEGLANRARAEGRPNDYGEDPRTVRALLQPLLDIGSLVETAPDVLRVVEHPAFDPLSDVALWVGEELVPPPSVRVERAVSELTPREMAFFELARQARFEDTWSGTRDAVEYPDRRLASYFFRASLSDPLDANGDPVTKGTGLLEAKAHLQSLADHGLLEFKALHDEDAPGWWPTRKGSACEPWIRKRLGWLYRLRWAGLESQMCLREGGAR